MSKIELPEVFIISWKNICLFQLCGIDQLWNIAVQVRSSEVSWAAITYLNSLYINGKHTFIFL